MRKAKNHERNNSRPGDRICFYGVILLAVKILTAVAILTSCTKDVIDKSAEYLYSGGVDKVFPSNLADSVEINPVIGVTFLPGTDMTRINTSTLTLKDGSSDIAGNVAVSGNSALFAFSSNLKPMTEYVATLRASGSTGSGNDSFEYSWKFKTGTEHRDNTLTVVSVSPPNLAKDVPASTVLTITLNKPVKSWMEGVISVTLEDGTTPVQGSMYFDNKVITYTPYADLKPGTIYTARFAYSPNSWVNNQNNSSDGDDEGDDDHDHDNHDINSGSGTGNKLSGTFTWNFTVAGGGSGSVTDITAPSVSNVVPAANAASVATNTTVSATFSEPVNSSTITSSTFNLKQGTVVIPGSVTSSGSTATFTPASALDAAKVYTATLTTEIKDAAGNALAANYTWNFTTATAADLIPPEITAVTPAENAADIATNSKVTVTFSEPMNSSTITSTTITLKQGSNGVSGTVSYSGNTATFTPGSALAGGTVYTATVTTGVKDASGNALASAYSWNFTTVAAPAGLSFANDVIPVLGECNACHTHKWVTSTNSSTYYNNLVSGGYINVSTPSSGMIYSQITSGHASSIPQADKDKILTWISEGSKNN